ncbi:MAG: acyl-CoA synthetase, partial [Hyphomicrobiales bacterium]|nr:acyl-CoA synthetase [Hyphomicrobiales bacterium]
AQRSGIYFTAVSSRLTAPEIAYIAKDCDAKMVFSSEALAAQAKELPALLPQIKHWYMLGELAQGYQPYHAARDGCPSEPIADECVGLEMLYSSGTTGRPKGIRRPLPPPETPIDEENILITLIRLLYGMNEQTIYLSPAPLYHAAPLRYSLSVQQLGGTCIVMEQFDPEQALQTIERYQATHSQWVPTMFVRMLKLPPEVRKKYDISSMKIAIHAAAPCPIAIKEQMLDWWGDVIYEYYAGSEGNGFCAIDSPAWREHKGSVGKALAGVLHICDDSGKELPAGESGTIYFESEDMTFTYHKDEERTAQSRHPAHKTWTTLGDVGYMDEEGYLYLTDRKAFMIISGGVNVYPQEAENILITHPKVADVAVIGVPNEDYGEEVKAVVQPMRWQDAGDALAQELIEFCKSQLSSIKCPRSVDFDKELPRHPTGKLYKRLIRDKYWGQRDSKIV